MTRRRGATRPAFTRHDVTPAGKSSCDFDRMAGELIAAVEDSSGGRRSQPASSPGLAGTSTACSSSAPAARCPGRERSSRRRTTNDAAPSSYAPPIGDRRHQRSPGFRPANPYPGMGVLKSLPMRFWCSRNSAVTRHTPGAIRRRGGRAGSSRRGRIPSRDPCRRAPKARRGRFARSRASVSPRPAAGRPRLTRLAGSSGAGPG